MLCEFQVLYRTTTGGVHERTVRALTAEEAKSRVRMIESVEAISVGPPQPVIDWSRPVFNQEEAAEFLRGSTRKIRSLMAAGHLPKTKNKSDPLYTRAALDRVVNELMEEAA